MADRPYADAPAPSSDADLECSRGSSVKIQRDLAHQLQHCRFILRGIVSASMLSDAGLRRRATELAMEDASLWYVSLPHEDPGVTYLDGGWEPI